jgi:D-alanyl-D-alanine carboxypeptidase/D-alanyl-D-alanine-endopeptidase (penicillin-binding protein 4)
MIILLVLLIEGFASSAGAQNVDDVFKKYGATPKQASITIGDADGINFALNKEKLLNPASITKLFVAAASLQKFGPSKRFTTFLGSRGKIANGVLAGDLHIIGAGDPYLSTSDLRQAISNFKFYNQIDSINGNVVVDNSYIEDDKIADNRLKTNEGAIYQAQSQSLSVNYNVYQLLLWPSISEGQQAIIRANTGESFFQIDNQTVTRKNPRKPIVVQRILPADSNREHLLVTGDIALSSRRLVLQRSVSSPQAWAGYQILDIAREIGLKISGTVAFASGLAAKDYPNRVGMSSLALREIIAEMNKDSHNYTAELLTKHLVAESSRKEQMSLGLSYIRDSLTRYSIDASQVRIQNPAGLTRDNRISSEAIWKLLKYMQEDISIGPEFISSLSIAGEDGTTRRLNHSFAQIRVKTGYLNGVDAIAGYVYTKNKKIKIFSLIYNGKMARDKSRKMLWEIVNTVIIN